MQSCVESHEVAWSHSSMSSILYINTLINLWHIQIIPVQLIMFDVKLNPGLHEHSSM